jgi:ABC-type glutathione transport system ATPase component
MFERCQLRCRGRRNFGYRRVQRFWWVFVFLVRGVLFNLLYRLRVGKSTLAKILLRILEFDDGELFVNDVDIRRLNPLDYHRRLTAVFQGFSRFNATVKENIGVGQVEKLGSRTAITDSIRLAGAENIVDSLPHGLRTKLNGSGGFESMACSSLESLSGIPTAHPHHGLSGGEVSTTYLPPSS